MSAAERVRALVQPIVEGQHADLYDVEHEAGVLRVVVDRDGGIDVDTIGVLAKLISDALDHDDPIPDSHYLLEVTSPGVERKLRTPEHFRRQVGEVVSVKLHAPVNGARRIQATLLEVTEKGIALAVDGDEDRLDISFDDIDSARSVFDWDAATGDTRVKHDATTQGPSATDRSAKPPSETNKKAEAR